MRYLLRDARSLELRMHEFSFKEELAMRRVSILMLVVIGVLSACTPKQSVSESTNIASEVQQSVLMLSDADKLCIRDGEFFLTQERYDIVDSALTVYLGVSPVVTNLTYNDDVDYRVSSYEFDNGSSVKSLCLSSVSGNLSTQYSVRFHLSGDDCKDVSLSSGETIIKVGLFNNVFSDFTSNTINGMSEQLKASGWTESDGVFSTVYETDNAVWVIAIECNEDSTDVTWYRCTSTNSSVEEVEAYNSCYGFESAPQP